MPFKSEKQRRFMFKKHPEIAHKWADEGKGYVAKSNDVDDEQNEELEKAPSNIFLDMPNSIKQMRVRDAQTGKFVSGSASLLADQFKRERDVQPRG